jgi:MGT family glycosyltransferase
VAKIAVVTVPFFSHEQAAIRLSATIVRQGHEVIVWAPAHCRIQLQEAGAKFEPHEPAMPNTKGLGFAMDLMDTTEQMADELVRQLHEYDVDMIIHDSQTPWAKVAAEYLGLPRAVAHPMYPIVAPYAKPSRADPNLPEPPQTVAIAHLADRRVSIARKWGVELEHDHRLIHSSAETMIAFTTEKLIGSFSLDSNWHCVGPLLSPPPPAAPPGDRPLVYVCFGTAYNKRRALFKAVIEGLAEEPVDVLISAGARGRRTISARDLEPLPPNTTFARFVPAREVLSRATVHITHGGCNSVHESLLAGVPMVCIPQAFDQFPLSRTLDLLGAGVFADENPKAIRDAVRLILNSDKARAKAHALSEHLVDYDGEGRVAELIDRVLADEPVLSA